MRRTILAAMVTTALNLAGCVSTREIMGTWIGANDVNLMSVWGVPHAMAIAANGIRILTYYDTNDDGQVVCQKTFVVGLDGRVVNAGTNCL
jgi:hypothetical protein